MINLLLHVLSRLKPTTRFTTTRILWWLTLSALIASALRLFGSVLGDHSISVLVPCVIVLCVFIMMQLLSYRSPVVLGLDRAERQIRAVGNADNDLESINRRLETEKWFLDPNLKIRSLSRKLGRTEAELSTLIKAAEGKNFNGYINGFRIEHAKHLLRTQLDLSILNVAHDSGFNSPSVFYSHFSSITGLTPKQYREESVKNSTAVAES